MTHRLFRVPCPLRQIGCSGVHAPGSQRCIEPFHGLEGLSYTFLSSFQIQIRNRQPCTRLPRQGLPRVRGDSSAHKLARLVYRMLKWGTSTSIRVCSTTRTGTESNRFISSKRRPPSSDCSSSSRLPPTDSIRECFWREVNAGCVSCWFFSGLALSC